MINCSPRGAAVSMAGEGFNKDMRATMVLESGAEFPCVIKWLSQMGSDAVKLGLFVSSTNTPRLIAETRAA
jgi:hypothetical protein